MSEKTTELAAVLKAGIDNLIAENAALRNQSRCYNVLERQLENLQTPSPDPVPLSEIKNGETVFVELRRRHDDGDDKEVSCAVDCEQGRWWLSSSTAVRRSLPSAEPSAVVALREERDELRKAYAAQ